MRRSGSREVDGGAPADALAEAVDDRVLDLLRAEERCGVICSLAPVKSTASVPSAPRCSLPGQFADAGVERGGVRGGDVASVIRIRDASRDQRQAR